MAAVVCFWSFVFPLLFASLLINGNGMVCMQTPAERLATQHDTNHWQKSNSKCYDLENRAQRCVPDFKNAAFNLPVEISKPEFTCGIRRPSRYCVQTGNTVVNKTCSVCDNRIGYLAHPPSLLTDFNDETNETLWQSVTMEEDIHKSIVNLTLRLGKTHDITYIRLKFASPRPESFVIYKRARAGDPWIPWQYYSGSCLATFKLPERAPILAGNEAVAQCTREFSDISPLTGGNIAFSTLEGRPSAENFEESEVLQEWVTATEIRISLVRLNTFGDEVFRQPAVLRTYFYAIIDFSVGGRCKCNGHAKQCVKSTGSGKQQQLVCDCKHNTVGADCQECAPFYVDRPWRPATSKEANECQPCKCNGFSNRCFFDAKMFQLTGHGGHCIDCSGNTQGPNCEQCLPGHWRPASFRLNRGECRPCQCDSTGSVGQMCDEETGQCICKPGVEGLRCEKCKTGFFGFDPSGCSPCQCERAGAINQSLICSPFDGSCACKRNVEGKRCERCKPGYFRLSEQNPFGCMPCFCYGHSSVCSAENGYYSARISSDFTEDNEKWTVRTSIVPKASKKKQKDAFAKLEFDAQEKAISVLQLSNRPAYFCASAKFLGDQRLSYGQTLNFSLRVLHPYAAWSSKDLVLAGSNGRLLSLPLGAQGNPSPARNIQQFSFRIHADPQLQWNSLLSEIDFIGVLSNLSAICLRGTYSHGDKGFLYQFSLGTASTSTLTQGIIQSDATAVDWVEKCQCPLGFGGQFCEYCAFGFKRAEPFGGSLTKCVLCHCNGHGQLCDPESGVCQCEHNTGGDQCERCARGYYGDALAGTSKDCRSCDCPQGGPCVLVDGEVMCTECPEGYTGRKCEYCSDEYFGAPLSGVPCKKCNCHGNVDSNAIGQCNHNTGECLRCIYHTTGWNCEKCAAGYWGNALAEGLKGDCKPCKCFAPGTRNQQQIGFGQIGANESVLECAQMDGQCDCLPNVVGQPCDECSPGFFNISSGNGCLPCECDPLGSRDGGICDLVTGHCNCKKGIIGQKCDQCAPRHYGFGSDGCAKCICDSIGAETQECDIRNGQCLCRDWVEGRQCDRCAENHHSMSLGCPPCDDCYALIQQRKNWLNESLVDLGRQLDDFKNIPILLNDSNFDQTVQEIFSKLENLKGKIAVSKHSTNQHPKLKEDINIMKRQLNEAISQINSSKKLMVGMNEELDGYEGQLRMLEMEREQLERKLEFELRLNTVRGNAQLEFAKNEANKWPKAEQKLSKMADEASKLEQKINNNKMEISKLALQIAQQSSQALIEAENAVFFAVNASFAPELIQLEAAANKSTKEMGKLKQLANEVGQEAEMSKNEAALLLAKNEPLKEQKELGEKINMSIVEIRNKLEWTEEKILEINAQVSKIENMAKKELQASKTELDSAKNELKAIIEEMEFVNGLEEKAKNAKRIVEEMVANGTKTFLILNEREKLKAEKEELEIALIEAKGLPVELKETTKMLVNIEAVIKKRQNKANKLLRRVKGKKEKAEKIAQTLNTQENKLEHLQQLLKTTKKQMDELESGILEKHDVKNREQDIFDEIQLWKNTLHEAASVEISAKSLNLSLDENEKVLNILLDRLDSLSTLDDAEMDQLEKELTKVELKYDDSNFERAIDEQKVRQSQLDGSILSTQIHNLQEDLHRLNEIKESLPTECFNIVRIEQNEQH